MKPTTVIVPLVLALVLSGCAMLTPEVVLIVGDGEVTRCHEAVCDTVKSVNGSLLTSFIGAGAAVATTRSLR